MENLNGVDAWSLGLRSGVGLRLLGGGGVPRARKPLATKRAKAFATFTTVAYQRECLAFYKLSREEREGKRAWKAREQKSLTV